MKKKIIIIMTVIVLLIGLIFGIWFVNNKDTDIKKIFKPETYKEYKVGEVITFKDQEWYVLYDSDKKTDYVTLLSADLLYLADDGIENVFNDPYDESLLNKYLENDYLNNLGSDNFVEVEGYKVRLLNMKDINNFVEVIYNEENDEYNLSDCPQYLCLPNASFATMIETKNKEFTDVYNDVEEIEDPLYDEYTLHLKYYRLTSTYDTNKLVSLVEDTYLLVRTVINVYKNSLE